MIKAMMEYACDDCTGDCSVCDTPEQYRGDCRTCEHAGAWSDELLPRAVCCYFAARLTPAWAMAVGQIRHNFDGTLSVRGADGDFTDFKGCNTYRREG
jgi:hypothetical protein